MAIRAITIFVKTQTTKRKESKTLDQGDFDRLLYEAEVKNWMVAFF